MTLRVGGRLGPYEISSQIGEGGMGVVYRARDTKLNRHVALKVLPDRFARDPERLARFQREAQVLASLNHPNIATIHGLEEADGITALVLEFVEGPTLADWIRQHAERGFKNSRAHVEETLAIARQIAEALEAAHEHGVIHRDLKPANIKVRPDGTVNVLDFGLAKLTDTTGPFRSGDEASSEGPTLTAPAATRMGVILGTAAYMSPEQARGMPVDTRTDVWAFGCVVYEMLTGTRAFAGDDAQQVIAKVIERDPDWTTLPPGTPASVLTLLARCLAKDPKRRLRDIGDAWLWLEHAPAEAKPDSPPQRRILPPVLAASIAIVLVLAALPLFREASTPSPLVFSELAPDGTQFVAAPLPSPDGRYLAMRARDERGETRIWLRPLEAERAQPLNETEGAALMIWSPDAQELAFYADGQLRRVARQGGPTHLVAAVRAAAAGGGAWTPGGDLIVSAVGQGVVRVPAAGGTPRTIMQREGTQYRDLGWLPGAERLFFAEFGGDEPGVYTSDVEGGARTLLMPGGDLDSVRFLAPDLLLYRKSGMLMGQRLEAEGRVLVGDPFPIAEEIRPNSYEGGPSGTLTVLQGMTDIGQLTWFDREGRPGETLGPEGLYEEVHLSPDGKTLLFVQTDVATGNRDLWIKDLAGGAAFRLSVDPDTDHLAAFSPDGAHVAWEAHEGGALNLVQRPTDGSAPPSLVRKWGRGGGPTDWSPDGRFIVYASADGATGSNLWAVPVDGDAQPTPIIESPFDDRSGRLSPDGKFLAYVSDETGREEVYIQRVEGMRAALGDGYRSTAAHIRCGDGTEVSCSSCRRDG